MVRTQRFVIRDRKQAGEMLVEKLMQFKNSGAVVVGVPYGGAVVGFHVAEGLGLAFDVSACRTIQHPADARKTIGSVSIDQAVIHDGAREIPCDYIHHQVVRFQNEVKTKHAFYHAGSAPVVSLTDADVILTADVVKNADSLIALVKTIRRQRAKNIVLAAALITYEALRVLESEVDKVVSLMVDAGVPASGLYEENAIVRDEDIRELITRTSTNKQQ